MKCFECGGEMLEMHGSVRMTKKDGSLIIFKGIPLYQCRQCGEQYVPGKWAENIGGIMRDENAISPDEIMAVPVIALHG